MRDFFFIWEKKISFFAGLLRRNKLWLSCIKTKSIALKGHIMALSKSPIVCEQNDGCHIDPWNMIKELSKTNARAHATTWRKEGEIPYCQIWLKRSKSGGVSLKSVQCMECGSSLHDYDEGVDTDLEKPSRANKLKKNIAKREMIQLFSE